MDNQPTKLKTNHQTNQPKTQQNQLQMSQVPVKIIQFFGTFLALKLSQCIPKIMLWFQAYTVIVLRFILVDLIFYVEYFSSHIHFQPFP